MDKPFLTDKGQFPTDAIIVSHLGKSKTLWVAFFDFTDKAAPAIAASTIADALKEQFETGKAYGKIRGLTIVPTKKRDIEDAKALVALKLSLKQVDARAEARESLSAAAAAFRGSPTR